MYYYYFFFFSFFFFFLSYVKPESVLQLCTIFFFWYGTSRMAPHLFYYERKAIENI